MKKNYTLDMNIQSDIDRCKAVSDILEKIEYTPNQKDLEQMADYIICGKDENNENLLQKGLAYLGSTRYGSYKKKSEKGQSLEALNESGPSPRTEKDQPKYLVKHSSIDRKTDAWIPGMQQLWDTIDRLSKQIEELTPFESALPVSYRKYKLKHQLIATRLDQYVLKDAYAPEIHLLDIAHPSFTGYNWDSDSYYWMTEDEWRRKIENSYRSYNKNLDHYETRINNQGVREVRWHVRHHTFNWENKNHVKHLIRLYSDLSLQYGTRLYDWAWTLLIDLQLYANKIVIPEHWRAIYNYTIEGLPTSAVVKEMNKHYGYKYSINYINTIIGEKIPERITSYVRRQREKDEWDGPMKKCVCCQRTFPRSPLFFYSRVKDYCIECAERKYINDRRKLNDKRFKCSHLS